MRCSETLGNETAIDLAAPACLTAQTAVGSAPGSRAIRTRRRLKKGGPQGIDAVLSGANRGELGSRRMQGGRDGVQNRAMHRRAAAAAVSRLATCRDAAGQAVASQKCCK